MDIFNGNRKLEESVMYGLDWGVFLRHDMEGTIAPFMYLFQGEETLVKVLMTEGDPVEYAKSILAKEERSFQQIVIGYEGYLRGQQNERVDAIIVQGFDKTQEKGVALGQMIEPKEKNGKFRKIDKVTFLGNPELIVPLKRVENPDYAVDAIGFNAVSLRFGSLIQYMAFFTHDNPSVIANSMKMFLRSKIMGEEASTLNGRFDLKINPGKITNDAFLRFLVVNALEEERTSPHAKAWEMQQGRKILFNVSHGEQDYFSEFVNETKKEESTDILSPKTSSQSPTKPIVVKKLWWKFW